MASMHKRPENEMWLPTGGQLETVMYVFPPRHKENGKKEGSLFTSTNYIDRLNESSIELVLVKVKP